MKPVMMTTSRSGGGGVADAVVAIADAVRPPVKMARMMTPMRLKVRLKVRLKATLTVKQTPKRRSPKKLSLKCLEVMMMLKKMHRKKPQMMHQTQ